MTAEQCIQQLRSTVEYFDRSTRCLKEEHASFRPTPEMFSVAEQVAHVALSMDWLVEGASRPEGFDMDFEEHQRQIKDTKSLQDARKRLEQSYARAEAWAKAKSPAELAAPLPAGPVMGGAPKFVIFNLIDEHTAHHRGALTVYARLQGLTPAMPYMEMERHRPKTHGRPALGGGGSSKTYGRAARIATRLRADVGIRLIKSARVLPVSSSKGVVVNVIF